MAGKGMTRIAVVGAGLAGLAAAHELTELGADVTILERTRLVGGKATSFEAGGVEVDNGQHVFLGCFDAWRRLVRAVEAEDQLYLQPRFETVLLARGGRSARLRAAGLPAPWHLGPALLGHRLLGVSGRLQVARAMRAASDPAGPDETVAGWLDRRGQGERARAAFWEPFLVPALNAPLTEAAAEAGRFVLTTAFLGGPEACRIGWSRVPLARIAEAVAARSGSLQLRSPVTELRVRDGRLRALVVQHQEHTQEVEVDGAVLAVPPGALARLLGQPERFGVTGLERFATQPIVDVHLWYDGARPSWEFAALVGSPVQWVFQKQPGYLCCSLSAAGDTVRRPETDLVRLCHEELAAAVPELRGQSPRGGRATRDPEATFVPRPGLQRPGAATTVPNLVLAGAWTDTGWPATMESAVRSGSVAARTLAGQLVAEPDAAGAPEEVPR
ncbi:MAG TPA: hydroxysqualene dehydroxylase HpnE [Candidatus Binatia bacterium]|nr:hydroxysqualene dehydroxylase HpnE [Candidatus Binatia bacterium]